MCIILIVWVEFLFVCVDEGIGEVLNMSYLLLVWCGFFKGFGVLMGILVVGSVLVVLVLFIVWVLLLKMLIKVQGEMLMVMGCILYLYKKLLDVVYVLFVKDFDVKVVVDLVVVV